MVEAIFPKAIAIGIFCIFFVQASDILEYFRPNPKLPKELNEFLTSVQEHKEDFQLIREAADKANSKKGVKNQGHRELLEEAEENSLGHKYLRKRWSDDRPRNDIYPYMYSNQPNKNSKYDLNEKDIAIEPRSKSGNIERPGEKYPGRRFANIKREGGDDDFDDDRDNIFGNNKYQGDLGKSIKKREIEIEVKSDGKLVKRIREQDMSSKSLILNIHPKNEQVKAPKSSSLHSEDQENIEDEKNEDIPLTDKMKDKEFKSNFENLYMENENLNTDRSLISDEIPTKLFYQVTYPNNNPEPNDAELARNNLHDNKEMPQRNSYFHNPRIQQDFNDGVQLFSTESPIYPRKSLQEETESGFENVHSVVLDTNNNIREPTNWKFEEKPEKRQSLDTTNLDLISQEVAIPDVNSNLLKNDIDRSISDFVLPENEQAMGANPDEGYRFIEQSTTKVFTENCEGGQAIIQEKQGTVFLSRNPQGECVESAGEKLHSCTNNEEEKMKEIEQKIEEVGSKLEAGGSSDMKNELMREHMKLQEEELKMEGMNKKIECLENEIKHSAADSSKSDEIEEVESKIDDEEDKINEIEEKLDDIEEEVEEKAPENDESKGEQNNLKEEIKKVQEAEEKIADEAKKIEEHEKQLANAVEQKQQNLPPNSPNKDSAGIPTTAKSRNFEEEAPIAKFQKEIKDSDLSSNAALPQNIAYGEVNIDNENSKEAKLASDLIEASGGRHKKINTIEIIETEGHQENPEIKFHTETSLVIDDNMKRTERALAIISPQRSVKRIPVRDSTGKIRKIYLIRQNSEENDSEQTGRSPRKHERKKKRKKKKKHHKHRISFRDYLNGDYMDKFNDEDTNNNSDLIPAFKTRHLQAMYDTYMDTEDADEYEDDHKFAEIQVTRRTNAIEGDYSDDEEPSGNKNKNDKLTIKKKSENEFSDPVDTTKFDEYYDDDYNGKNSGEHQNRAKANIKDEETPLHEIFEDTFSFDTLKNSGSHLQKRAHHGHSKKKKKPEPVKPEHPKRIEPKRKMVKDVFKHLKNFKKVTHPKRRQSTPKKPAFKDVAEQQKLPKFVIDDRIQQENIRKRSLDVRKSQINNQNKFPISTRNFFVKPKKKSEQYYSTDTKKKPWNFQKKRAEPLSPDPGGVTQNVEENIERNEKSVTAEEHCTESKPILSGTTTDNTEIGVSVGNVCEEDNNTGPVILETMLPLVPDMEIDNNTMVTTSMMNESENTTKSEENLESATGLCVKTSAHTKLDDILNGFLPSKLVTDVKNKIKENPNLSRRFEHGLLKHFKMDTNMMNPNESVVEIEKLMKAMTEIMNKIADTASCQKLPHPIQEYIVYLTKNEKGDVLAKPKEMEDIRFNDNENADSYLYDQSLHEKVNVMKSLLDRYNKLPDNCKVRAEPVKEYIDSHLSMLTNMTQQSNLHSAKRSYDINSALDEKNDQPFSDVLFEGERGRVNKRDVNRYSQSKQYQKLVDAVSRMRHKRENERMIGELFGGGQERYGGGEADGGGGYESPLVYSV